MSAFLDHAAKSSIRPTHFSHDSQSHEFTSLLNKDRSPQCSTKTQRRTIAVGRLSSLLIANCFHLPDRVPTVDFRRPFVLSRKSMSV